VAALGDDQVGVPLARFDELQMHGPDDLAVLPHHRLEAAAALGDVPGQAADQALVVVHVHVQPDVHEPAQVGVLQHQDALDEHDVRRLHPPHRTGAAVAGVIIDGHVHRHAGPQVLQVSHQQSRLERLGVVVVDPLALRRRHVGVVTVVGVVVQDGHGLARRRLAHPGRDGGLARPRAPGHADDHRRQRLCVLLRHGRNLSGRPAGVNATASGRGSFSLASPRLAR
jgi:hypothetical protein